MICVELSITLMGTIWLALLGLDLSQYAEHTNVLIKNLHYPSTCPNCVLPEESLFIKTVYMYDSS